MDLLESAKQLWGGMGHAERFGAEAAVAGTAILGYEEWRKYHNVEHSAEAQANYSRYQQGYKSAQEQPSVFQQAQQGWNSLGKGEKFAAEAAVLGTAFVGYEEWRKHHGRGHSEAAKAEYEEFKSHQGW
ncbi:hypothetical protein HDU83_009762 [Entophlyctis luteolus]|nr:hypothetical protein HDU83_009762 [Entophlyctis luteolus]KAJ3370871.1 hypothetical protein HDU84_001353 [Entophlyctis sp. JEL0112]